MSGMGSVEPSRLVPLVALALLTSGAPMVAGAARERPNVVIIVTDDQTPDTLAVMPQTLGLLAAQGTTFTDAVSVFPLCAPSRATLLTARYARRHGVRSNVAPPGGFERLAGIDTLPVLLQRAGYTTAHVGKYVNEYGMRDPVAIPPGYDAWFALIDPSTYRMYDYLVNDGGIVRRFTNGPAAYQTDVLADRAVALIRAMAEAPRPFYLQVAPLAPHQEIRPVEGVPLALPPRAALRHAGLFDSVPLPESPAFNELDVTDKPAGLRARPRLDAGELADITALYRGRLASLRAVDDLVARIVSALDETGELARTLIVFTSDNGMLLGDHRLVGKLEHYAPSLGIPLIIRGPGFRAGETRSYLVSNVDVATTFATMAGARSIRDADGRRLDAIARRRSCVPPSAVVLEGHPVLPDGTDPQMTQQGIRTARYRYTEHASGERELYDLGRDPFELESVHDDPAYQGAREALARLLDRLRVCEGPTCRERPRIRVSVSVGPTGARRARVRGPDLGLVESTTFSVRGEARGTTDAPPHRLVLPRTAGHEIAALARLVDGRELTLVPGGRECWQ